MRAHEHVSNGERVQIHAALPSCPIRVPVLLSGEPLSEE